MRFETVANSAAQAAWLAAQWPAHLRFRRALSDPAGCQRDLLLRLLRANGECAYARQHRWQRVRDVRSFQDEVPVVSYDDLIPWIERIKNGEPKVLTCDPILMMEKSSGSAAAAKYIPYTQSLRREFQNALGAWMWNLYGQDPGLLRGKSYWVITPMARERERTAGGLQIGFEADSEYFGRMHQLLLRQILAVPDALARIPDIESSMYVTLRFLLQTRSLVFISVWNPGFLLILTDKLREFGDRLAWDLERGSVHLSMYLHPATARRLANPAVRCPMQAVALRQFLREGSSDMTRLFPALRKISCWASASAKPLIAALQERFPGVTIQGKGLLATEGVVSIPLDDYEGCVPACTSHFLEFLEAGSGRPQLMHELQAGREYSVILTTGGGLWRYRLGDRVRVTAMRDLVPVLEFVGKEDGVSDLCGEKLSPLFVGQVLEKLRQSGALGGEFAMLAPALSRRRYILFTDRAFAHVEALDAQLCANPHYEYCRRVGQLDAPAVFYISGRAQESYVNTCESLGQRAGAVKLTPLHSWSGWEERFQGEFLPSAVEEMV